MANNDSEEDEFFGSGFPYLGPDEDEEETQPEQSAGPRANSHPPSNVVGPPANAGQPPANVPLTPRQILNRIYAPAEPRLSQEQLAERQLQSHPDPRGRRVVPLQAYFDHPRRHPGLQQTLSQPPTRRESILEEHPLSLASASPYTQDSESGHSHPHSSLFPTGPGQLRPPPPLPPRRTLRLSLRNPAPAVGPRNQVYQSPYVQNGEASLRANAQAPLSPDSDATISDPENEASPSEELPVKILRTLQAKVQNIQAGISLTTTLLIKALLTKAVPAKVRLVTVRLEKDLLQTPILTDHFAPNPPKCRITMRPSLPLRRSLVKRHCHVSVLQINIVACPTLISLQSPASRRYYKSTKTR